MEGVKCVEGEGERRKLRQSSTCDGLELHKEVQ